VRVAARFKWVVCVVWLTLRLFVALEVNGEISFVESNDSLSQASHGPCVATSAALTSRRPSIVPRSMDTFWSILTSHVAVNVQAHLLTRLVLSP